MHAKHLQACSTMDAPLTNSAEKCNTNTENVSHFIAHVCSSKYTGKKSLYSSLSKNIVINKSFVEQFVTGLGL